MSPLHSSSPPLFCSYCLDSESVVNSAHVASSHNNTPLLIPPSPYVILTSSCLSSSGAMAFELCCCSVRTKRNITPLTVVNANPITFILSLAGTSGFMPKSPNLKAILHFARFHHNVRWIELLFCALFKNDSSVIMLGPTGLQAPRD